MSNTVEPMKKHTPGPWKSVMKVHVVDVNDTRIADVIDRFDGKDNNFKSSAEANARLIAAAPELLEVLIDAREDLAKRTGEFGADWDGTSMLIRMDTAIAKAAGRG